MIQNKVLKYPTIYYLGLFNPLIEKFMVKKFMVEKFMAEMFMAENDMVEKAKVEQLMVESEKSGVKAWH